MVVAFTLYYSLIAQIGEGRATLGNYLTLIFALLYGFVLLGEPFRIAAVVDPILPMWSRDECYLGPGRVIMNTTPCQSWNLNSLV